MALGSSLAGSAKVVLTADTSQFDRGMNEAQGRFHRNVNEIEHDSERMGRGILSGSGAFSHLGRSIAFASGAFLGAAGFTAVVKDSIGQASDLNKAVERTSVVFGQNAHQIEVWSETTAKSMGIARGDALNAADSFGALFKAMGITGSQSTQMSTSLVKLSADIGALKNVAPERVLGALTTGIAGRTRGLREFGIVIDQAQVKEEAYRLGLVKTTVSSQKVADANVRVQIEEAKLAATRAKYGPGTTQVAAAELSLQKAREAATKATQGSGAALDQHAKALATYSLIMKQTADAQGQFSRHSGDLAEQERILRAEVTGLEEGLGRALIPTVTRLIHHLTDWLGNTRNTQRVQRDLTEAVKTLTGVAQTLGGVIKTAASVFKTLSGAVGGSKNAMLLLIGAFATFKGTMAALSFASTLKNIGLIGSSATVASGEVTGLRGALLSLGSSPVLAALAAAGAGLAILATVKWAGTGVAAGFTPGGGGSTPDRPTGPAGYPPLSTWTQAEKAAFAAQHGPQTAEWYSKHPAAAMRVITREMAKEAAAAAATDRAAADTKGRGGATAVSWSGDHAGLDGGFKSKLEKCVAAAGGTAINVTSGRRTPEHNRAVGGASNSNHLTGHAADGTCTINGQSYPLGQAPIDYGGYGLRAGSTFVWKGAPDIYHVDDGTNVGGDTGATTDTTTNLHVGAAPPTPPAYDPIPKGLQVRLARAQALTPKGTADDLAALQAQQRALRAEGPPKGADDQITYYQALRSVYDQIASLTGTKGGELLPLNLQQALAAAGTTKGAGDDLKAFDNAISFVERRLHTAGLAAKSRIKLEKLLRQLFEQRNRISAPIVEAGLAKTLPRLPSLVGMTAEIGDLKGGQGTTTVTIPGIGKILTAFSLTPTVAAWNKIIAELKKKYAAAQKRLTALQRSLAKAKRARFPNKTLIGWLNQQIKGLQALIGQIKTDLGEAISEVAQLVKDAADKAQQDADESDKVAEGGAANVPTDIQQALADAELSGDTGAQMAALKREEAFLQNELDTGKVTTADGRTIDLTPEARLAVTQQLASVRSQEAGLAGAPTDPNAIPIDLQLQLARAQGTKTTADDLAALQAQKGFVTGRLAAVTDPAALLALTNELNTIQGQIDTIINNQGVQIDQQAQFQEFFTGLRGLRGFESNILGAALGGSTIQVTNYFSTGPDDPHTFSAGLSFELRALVG